MKFVLTLLFFKFKFYNKKMEIKLIQVKSMLNRSKINNGYTLNPYLGCPQDCVYCYNQHFIQRLRPKEKWGQFLDVKINAPEILTKEIIKKPKMPVFLSTVTDPFNPLETKYQITHKCLKILIENFWPISILTKSNLILNDLNLLKMGRSNIEVGFTITTLDDRVAKIIEPKTSPPTNRIQALDIFKRTGFKTYAFIGPILPELTELPALFQTLKNKADEIWLDTLNTNPLNWQGIKKTIQKHWPKILPIYEQNFFKDRKKYQIQLRHQAQNLSQKYQIPVKICF